MHVPDFAFDPSITSSFNKKITENVGHIFQKVTKITTVTPLRIENSDILMK